MKNLKTVLVTGAVIMLLIVVIVLLADKALEPQKEIRSRIGQYKLIAEEQRLITEIVTLRYEAALIQAKLQPAPQPVPVIPAPEPNE